MIYPFMHTNLKFLIYFFEVDNIILFLQTWTLTVIDAPDVNAFVLPSGNIFVYTGLLKVSFTCYVQ